MRKTRPAEEESTSGRVRDIIESPEKSFMLKKIFRQIFWKS
jgi:hypothetical protein